MNRLVDPSRLRPAEDIAEAFDMVGRQILANVEYSEEELPWDEREGDGLGSGLARLMGDSDGARQDRGFAALTGAREPYVRANVIEHLPESYRKTFEGLCDESDGDPAAAGLRASLSRMTILRVLCHYRDSLSHAAVHALHRAVAEEEAIKKHSAARLEQRRKHGGY